MTHINNPSNTGTRTSPDYKIIVFKDIGGKRKQTEIGYAYENGRGSVTCYIAALPLNDTIHLVPLDRENLKVEDLKTGCSPDFLVKAIADIGGKDNWFELGVAYRTARKSITIYLTAKPLNEKFHLIPNLPGREV